jgi:hypothetical protein
MRRQTRPFTVEVKQKARHAGGSRSIWGDIDLLVLSRQTVGLLTPMHYPLMLKMGTNP